MCNQYACYLFAIGRDAVPVATGPTREAALEKGTPRALAIAASEGVAFMGHSSIGVQTLPDLSEFDFAKLGETLDTFAEERLGL